MAHLGFTAEDPAEHIRRVTEVAKLMVGVELIVLTAFISPYRSARHMARSLFRESAFIEVFMDTPLEIAERRDPKGLYKKAQSGELKNFTGIETSYKWPESQDCMVSTASTDTAIAAELLM